jgi:mono/diheme cytochrome c family protein
MKLAAAVTVFVAAIGGFPLAAQAPVAAVQPPAGPSGLPRSVWDGVYTVQQAKRGALKSGLCVNCHGDGFVGGPAPELAGPAFAMRWDGRTVGDLFDLIRLTMPDDDPGALAREEYADLVAYIFSVNKYPAGSTEIGLDAAPLKQIRIEAAKP